MVAEHLFKALKQFYKMFPEYRDTDFYIAGESYAGFMLISVFTYYVCLSVLTHLRIAGVWPNFLSFVCNVRRWYGF